MSRLFYSIVGVSLCVAGGLQAQQQPAGSSRASKTSSSAVASATGGQAAVAHSSSHSSTAGPIHPSGVVTFGSAALPDWQSDLETAKRNTLRTTRELQWGLTTIAIPAYLKHEQLGLAEQQGLLITSILPGSPAELAGLQAGETLVEINGIPCEAGQPLPRLKAAPRTLLVMGNGGLRETQITAGHHDGDFRGLDEFGGMGELGGQDGDLLLPPALDLSGFLPPGMGWPAGPQVQSPVRSLAVSEANGRMHVSAVVACASGDEQIELRGSRAQVLRQLQSLSVEIQQALAPQLGL